MKNTKRAMRKVMKKVYSIFSFRLMVSVARIPKNTTKTTIMTIAIVKTRNSL